MLFETKPFWNHMLLFLVISVVLYLAVDFFVLKRFPKRSRNQNYLINGLLIAGLLFLFQLYLNISRSFVSIFSIKVNQAN